MQTGSFILSFAVAIYYIIYIKSARKYNCSIVRRTSYCQLFFPLFLGLSLRFILAVYTEGYATDMSCWQAWSNRAAENGPLNFYSDHYFCDYPPGYMYFLMIIGFLRNLFSSLPACIDTLLLKLPAIIFDLLTCLLLQKEALSESNDTIETTIFSLLYICNPAILMNSAVWGQVDSVFTLFIIISLLSLQKEKFTKSAIFWAISIIIKPQALLFFPLYILTVFKKRKMDKFIQTLLYCLSAFFLTFFILVIPFTIKQNPSFIFELYTKTLQSYPYASLNAFNIYTLLGANAQPIESTFIGLPFTTWGVFGITIALFIPSFIFYKSKEKSAYIYAAFLIIIGVFLLGTKMHERYLFPAVVLLFFVNIFRKDKRIYYLTAILSFLHFINVIYIYLLSKNGTFYALPPDFTASIISVLHVAAYVYAVYLGFSIYVTFPSKDKAKKNILKDWHIVTFITVIYLLFSFFNLGNITAPITPGAKDNLAKFNKKENIASVSVYKGIGDCTLYFEFSDDGTNWQPPLVFEGSMSFKWQNYPISREAEYVRIRFAGKADAVYEAAFWDNQGNLVSVNSDSFLFDEQNLVEYDITYLNSTYFDEIYHARTAYEHINYIPHYETTHPPLGKHIIGLGIRMFGMNPFGWRFMGTLFGGLMLPIVYLFAKRLFNSKFLGTAAMLLLAFDFMHFSQTRIATIDTYPVFFILLMYYFMYLFFEKAESLPPKKVLLFLGLSGVCFGLAISSKWIGFYGGAGLAILFFIGLLRRIRVKGRKELLICAPCLLFFIVIPFIIYYITYIPIHVADEATDFWKAFWNYQTHMFNYHNKLQADHPFGSKWYTWPFVIRPIWYYGNPAVANNGYVSSIVGMGNPLIWWASFASVLFCLFKSLDIILKKTNDYRTLFISVAFLSQLVPWMFIGRVVFIYHYFASLPFALLALVYIFELLINNLKNGKKLIIIFLTVSGILFALFYPVLSGLVVPKYYVLSCLKWFTSWTFFY